MKNLLRYFLIVFFTFLVIGIGLELSGNGHILEGLPQTYFRGLTKPDIDELKFSDTRAIAKANQPEPWKMAQNMEEITISEEDLAYHEELESTAFLVTKGDEILYEQYWEDYDEHTLSNSFSMAKTFTAMCIMRAEEEGWLRTTDKVCKYLPRFCEGENTKLTIEHLLQMSSNINFGESYSNPFGYQAKAYFNDDLFGLTAPYLVEEGAGTIWKYQGGDTVILHEVLESATGKSMAEFFSENFWQRIGTEHEAYWGLDDHEGKEKAFSAVYATARDFAKVGKLFRDQGRISNGEEALSAYSITKMKEPVNLPDKEGNVVDYYGYQLWLLHDLDTPVHLWQGMRGQYIINVPQWDMTIVRLGHERYEKQGKDYSEDVYRWIEMSMRMKDL